MPRQFFWSIVLDMNNDIKIICPYCKRTESIYEFTDVGKIITYSCGKDKCFEKAKKKRKKII